MDQEKKLEELEKEKAKKVDNINSTQQLLNKMLSEINVIEGKIQMLKELKNESSN